MSDGLKCKTCSSTDLEPVNQYEMTGRGGTITQVTIYRCETCGESKTRKHEAMGIDPNWKPPVKEKKEKIRGAVSIAKQLTIDKYKVLRLKNQPREIAVLYCQHFKDDDYKRICKACKQAIWRLDKKIAEVERGEKTLKDYDEFALYPVVQDFIKNRRDREVNYRGHVNKLRKYWEFLDRKHPITWDENDVVLLVRHIREAGVAEYHAQQPIRAWLKFWDIKDDRGRPLYNHALLEASREKMSVKKGAKNGGSKKRTYVEPKEFLEVLKNTPRLILKSMLWVHVSTGCREGTNRFDEYNRGRGGIMGLDWNAVDWKNRSIDVYETKTKGGITWVDCPLDLFGPDCYNLLRQFWEAQGSPQEGKMFPISYKSYTKFFREVVTKVVGRKITPHNMRDTHATWLLNMDVKVELIVGTTNRRMREGYGLGVGWMEPKIFFENYARIMRRKKDEEIGKAQKGFASYVA